MSQADDIKRLMQNARIALPGALDSVIQLEFFQVMNKFFQDSNCWREEIDFDVSPTDDSRDYPIAPSAGTINRLLWTLNANKQGQAVTMDTPGVLTLQIPPGAAETWTATVAITVTDPLTKDGYPDFPAWILNKWGSSLLSGVMARMMAQPAKPYSNVAMASYHGKQFNNAIGKAKVEASHGNVYGVQNWRFPRGFAARRIR